MLIGDFILIFNIFQFCQPMIYSEKIGHIHTLYVFKKMDNGYSVIICMKLVKVRDFKKYTRTILQTTVFFSIIISLKGINYCKSVSSSKLGPQSFLFQKV